MAYIRMVIGETVAQPQVDEWEKQVRKFMERAVMEYQVLREDGGNMVILVTRFETRGGCLAFHSSKMYWEFVRETSHLLVGNYVVKLFHETQRHVLSFH